MTIQIEGAKELRFALKQVEGDAKALKDAYRSIAVLAAADAQAAARSGSPLQQKMAGGIRPSATQTRAAVSFSRTKSYPATGVAFWGTQRRLGWFAKSQYSSYSSSDQKLPRWVGNSWTAATFGEGPHRVNDALAAHVPRYIEELEKGMEAAARRAGFF